jgi:DNA-binding response OmpR family regulator
MLTARSLVERRVEGLDAGADDTQRKPFAVAELPRARARLCDAARAKAEARSAVQISNWTHSGAA